jgi:hypothetical protein
MAFKLCPRRQLYEQHFGRISDYQWNKLARALSEILLKDDTAFLLFIELKKCYRALNVAKFKAILADLKQSETRRDVIKGSRLLTQLLTQTKASKSTVYRWFSECTSGCFFSERNYEPYECLLLNFRAQQYLQKKQVENQRKVA